VKTIDTGDNISSRLSFYFVGSKISVSYGMQVCQPILSFMTDYDTDKRKSYDLYKWYDEGKFPKVFETNFDTANDKLNNYRRLIVIGVDDGIY
jgi:hypothetical protein